MRSWFSVFLIGALALPVLAHASSGLSPTVTRAAVLIVNYNRAGNFVGWGTGFFVENELLVTNRHVVEAGAWHRVYATSANEAIDLTCFKDVLKGDVLTNIDADVAYMRAVLPCAHETLQFAADPSKGDPVSVIGYPYKGTTTGAVVMTITTGKVVGFESDGWIATDAYMDVGNSGGPVVNDTGVLGIAVAKSTDDAGNFIESFFIPASVVLEGLLKNSDPRFDYMPPGNLSSRSSQSSSSSSSSIRSSSSMSSSRRSIAPPAKPVTAFQQRTCERVLKRFSRDRNALQRVNERLQKRFGFVCR